MSPVVVRRSFTPGIGVSATGHPRSSPVAVEVVVESHVDLGLELVDVEALDTGRYRALVVQEPGNPRGLKGYVHLAAVGVRSAMDAAKSNDSFRENLNLLSLGKPIPMDWRHSANVRALDELALELETQTQLKATVDRDALLHESDWMETPFVLLTSAMDFEPTPQEVEQLGRYLVSGGFAYVEVVGGNSADDAADARTYDLETLRGLVTASLAGQGLQRGRDWEIGPLPLEHPLFSCYHEIGTLPRSYWSLYHTHNVLFVRGFDESWERSAWLGQAGPFLEGIYVRGRLAGVYSQQLYRDFWSRRIERGDAEGYWSRYSSDPALRLGVNCVVYALTQEGGLARQLVAQ